MKSTILMALAGLTSTASASLTVNLSFDKASIGIGETATATLTASFTGVPGTHFSTVWTDLIASGEYVTASASTGIDAWANPILGIDNGTPSGASLLGLTGSQVSLLPPVNTSNPLTVLSFTVTGTAEGVLTYGAAAVSSDGSFAIAGPDFFSDPPVWSDTIFSDSLVVTPAPGGVAMLGLAGLVAARRRR